MSNYQGVKNYLLIRVYHILADHQIIPSWVVRLLPAAHHGEMYDIILFEQRRELTAPCFIYKFFRNVYFFFEGLTPLISKTPDTNKTHQKFPVPLPFLFPLPASYSDMPAPRLTW